jgi:adenylylsulfate kinase
MKKIKILIMGLPGSGKTTLSEKLAPLLDAVRVNADKVRKDHNDWDFSLEGRLRQASRMKIVSDQVIKDNKNAVVDFVCPTKKTRKAFDANYIVWMNTIEKGRFEDTNQLFENPKKNEINFEVNEKDSEKYKYLILKDIKSFK